jgi:hypothetical protein
MRPVQYAAALIAPSAANAAADVIEPAGGAGVGGGGDRFAGRRRDHSG